MQIKKSDLIASAESIGISPNRVALAADTTAPPHAEKSWRFSVGDESLLVGYREIKVRAGNGDSVQPQIHYSAIDKKDNSDYEPGNLIQLGSNYSKYTKENVRSLGNTLDGILGEN